RESGRNAALVMCPSGKGAGFVAGSVRSQTSAPDRPPAATYRPSGENATTDTPNRRPERICTRQPPSEVHVPDDDLALVAAGRGERPVRADRHAPQPADVPGEPPHPLPARGVEHVDGRVVAGGEQVAARRVVGGGGEVLAG